MLDCCLHLTILQDDKFVKVLEATRPKEQCRDATASPVRMVNSSIEALAKHKSELLEVRMV